MTDTLKQMERDIIAALTDDDPECAEPISDQLAAMLMDLLAEESDEPYEPDPSPEEPRHLLEAA